MSFNIFNITAFPSNNFNVEEDYNKGLESNIYGTPTFFINEEAIVGAVSYKELKKVINEELNK